jgi:hypothetical protein
MLYSHKHVVVMSCMMILIFLNYSRNIFHPAYRERVFERTSIKADRSGAESQYKREKNKTITSTSSSIFLTTLFNPGCRIEQS